MGNITPPDTAYCVHATMTAYVNLRFQLAGTTPYGMKFHWHVGVIAIITQPNHMRLTLHIGPAPVTP